LPAGGGYADFLHGRVVDIFYFPLFRGNFPEWFPFWGGDNFLFFRPVFNVADVSITVGVASIILFYRGVFNSEELNGTSSSETAADAVTTTIAATSESEDTSTTETEATTETTENVTKTADPESQIEPEA